MTHQNKSKFYEAGYQTASAIGSYRRYSVLVIIVEAFFRKNMGERYFNGRSVLGGLVGLVVLRFFQSFDQSQAMVGEVTFAWVHFFDVFIIAYILLSLWHFIGHLRHRNTHKEEHSYYMGDSRWAFVARGLGIKRYSTPTFYVVEPLMLLLLAIPIFIYSFFLGIITILAAFRLWWENSKSLNQYWQEELNRRDSLKYGRHVQRKDKHLHQLENRPNHTSTKRKPLFQRKKEKQSQPTKVRSAPPSIQEALDNLSPNLKKMGKKH